MTLQKIWSKEQHKKEQMEQPTMEETEEEPLILEKGDTIFTAYFPDKEQHSEIVQATTTPSQQLVEAMKGDRPPKTFEELVPEEFYDFQDVFSKDSFNQLP